jgi:hypothetical protein
MSSAPRRDESAPHRDNNVKIVKESVDVDYVLEPRDLGDEVKSFSEAGRDTSPSNRKSLGQKYWEKMDKHFYEILDESKQGFKIKTIINIVIVIIGVLLVGNAITYTWIRGTDAWGLFSGGIGVASLVSLFFYRSQDAISKAVSNLSVVDMVFKSHYRAYEAITDYDYKADHVLPHRELIDLKNMLELLEKTTKVHVNLIKQIELTEISEPQDSTVKKHEKTTGQVADKVVKEKLKVP